MNDILPINKDVFIWARTSIGLSIEDVAHKLNKDPQEIEEWEKGNASPTYLQLEHLAHDIYKRPIAVFFFPKVPIEDNSKIYVYKLTTDNGGAPCVFNKLLSLAICKPKIRSTISINDWLIGFGGKTTIGERLIFVAKITKIILNGGYYKVSEYSDRPDCIYRWDKQENKYLWVRSKKYHRNGKFIEHDLGSAINNYNKANVLLSNEFSYLGYEGTDYYKMIYPNIKELIENLNQNHRNKYSLDLEIELRRLIEETMVNKLICKPSQLSDTCLCSEKDEDCF